MNPRDAAAEVGASASGEWDAEGNGRQSISQSKRAAKISTGCRRAERSRQTRELYTTALRTLAAVRPALLDLPPDRIERALEIVARHLLPGAPAYASAQFILRCRAPRSFARWLRRHPDLLAAVRRETRP